MTNGKLWLVTPIVLMAACALPPELQEQKDRTTEAESAALREVEQAKAQIALLRRQAETLERRLNDDAARGGISSEERATIEANARQDRDAMALSIAESEARLIERQDALLAAEQERNDAAREEAIWRQKKNEEIANMIEKGTPVLASGLNMAGSPGGGLLAGLIGSLAAGMLRKKKQNGVANA